MKRPGYQTSTRRVEPVRKRRRSSGVDTRPPTPCRHCGRPGTRPRGLCWPCYENEGIREQFARDAPQGIVRGHGRMPAEPTTALPGTEEKIKVLESRAERGEALFHPLDARMPDGSKKVFPCFDIIPEDGVDEDECELD